MSDNRRRPLRVEMVLPSLVTGGMEAIVARLGRALAERGVPVGFTLTVENGDFAGQMRGDGFDVCLIPQPARLASLRVSDLESRFRSRQPDIVHVHSGVWLRAARAAKRSLRCGVIHTAHGLLTREPVHGPLIKRLAMRYTDEVVAVSPSLASYMREKVGVPATRVQVIPNGVDTRAFAPAVRSGFLRAELGISDSAFVIGSVARLDPIKNQILMIEALPEILLEQRDAHVVFVGDGPERTRLTERAQSLGLQAKVHFAGMRPVERSLYAELDVFALPSFLEGTSISLLEAMSCGIPVVATSVGGTTSVLQGYPFSGSVPSGSVEQFASACVRLATHPSQREVAGSWLRQRVENYYSEAAMVDSYLELYERVSSISHNRRT